MPVDLTAEVDTHRGFERFRRDVTERDHVAGELAPCVAVTCRELREQWCQEAFQFRFYWHSRRMFP